MFCIIIIWQNVESDVNGRRPQPARHSRICLLCLCDNNFARLIIFYIFNPPSCVLSASMRTAFAFAGAQNETDMEDAREEQTEVKRLNDILCWRSTNAYTKQYEIIVLPVRRLRRVNARRPRRCEASESFVVGASGAETLLNGLIHLRSRCLLMSFTDIVLTGLGKRADAPDDVDADDKTTMTTLTT